MTMILDQKNSIKTYLGQKEVHSKLVKKCQVYDSYVDIQKEIINAIIAKCDGNPLLSITLSF